MVPPSHLVHEEREWKSFSKKEEEREWKKKKEEEKTHND